MLPQITENNIINEGSPTQSLAPHSFTHSLARSFILSTIVLFSTLQMRYYTSHSAVDQGQLDYIIKASGVVFDWLEVLFNHTYDMSKYCE